MEEDADFLQCHVFHLFVQPLFVILEFIVEQGRISRLPYNIFYKHGRYWEGMSLEVEDDLSPSSINF